MLAAIATLRADSSAASLTGGGAHASGDATTLVLRPAPAASESTPAGRFGDAPLEPGTRVGRYRIVEWVGAGGMGVVYAAFDPELNRKVAIKVLRYEVGKDDRQRRQFEERLRREAQVMARVAHPNVAAVYDVSEYGGRAFVAMEYIEGETLARWLKRRERPWPAVLERYVAAGRGLAAAHAAGLVHRDFKPQNVLVGEDGRVLVTDFGLARSVGDDEATAPFLKAETPSPFVTEPGQIVGTPAFMAPEQRSGCPVDARADQYSFCL
ncbi:MAG TPA: serine/threonine-protein kinase, partial [Polyangiaceae bacterium]|nr:serine/threonine-protein kinase [Polyangiaceae bacterium]